MTVTLTYTNGTFVPETAVTLPEGTRVELDLQTGRKPDQDNRPSSLEYWQARFPGTIGLFTREEADEMEREIDAAFGHVDEPHGR